jgi:putative endonuclease
VRRDRTLAFVEVKTRTTDAFGDPATAITPVKQLRLRRLAMSWLDAHDVRGTTLRFDVVCVLGVQVRVIEDAF